MFSSSSNGPELHVLFTPFSKAVHAKKLETLERLHVSLRNKLSLQIAVHSAKNEILLDSTAVSEYVNVQQKSIESAAQHIPLQPEDLDILSEYLAAEVMQNPPQARQMDKTLAFHMMKEYVDFHEEVKKYPHFDVYAPLHPVRKIFTTEAATIIKALHWLQESTILVEKHPVFRILIQDLKNLPTTFFRELQCQEGVELAESVRRYFVMLQDVIRRNPAISVSDKETQAFCKNIISFLRRIHQHLFEISALRAELVVHSPDFR